MLRLFSSYLHFLWLLSVFDDCLNLPASWRYITQLITAALMLGLSPVVQSLGISVASGSFLLLPLLVFLVLAVTAVINFTNFMDGLDGLVAGCGSKYFCPFLGIGCTMAVFGSCGFFALLSSLEQESREGFYG